VKKKKRPTKEIAKENDAKTPNLQTKKLKKKEDKNIYLSYPPSAKQINRDDENNYFTLKKNKRVKK
jgi:hypothetical protein